MHARWPRRQDRCASLALAPLPLIFSYKSEKSLCGTESYDCNCRDTYEYVKAWRSHRILSIGFDQPGNHHNPMRDPFPSQRVHAHNAEAGVFHVDHAVMSTFFRTYGSILTFILHINEVPCFWQVGRNR